MLRGLKQRFPRVHLKALTMVEIALPGAAHEDSGARNPRTPCATRVWIPLPGGGAEIFNERVGASSAITKSTAGSGWKARARRAPVGSPLELHHALTATSKTRRTVWTTWSVCESCRTKRTVS